MLFSFSYYALKSTVYFLEAETGEEYDVMEEQFGDVANWFVGECCFGGYCGVSGVKSPTDFFETIIIPFKQ